MLRLSADHDRVAAAAGQGLGNGRSRVQAFASLIESDHLEIGAEPHPARIRRQGAGQEVDERRLAGTVRPDDAEAVSAQDAQ